MRGTEKIGDIASHLTSLAHSKQYDHIRSHIEEDDTLLKRICDEVFERAHQGYTSAEIEIEKDGIKVITKINALLAVGNVKASIEDFGSADMPDRCLTDHLRTWSADNNLQVTAKLSLATAHNFNIILHVVW